MKPASLREMVEAAFREKIAPVMVPLPVDDPGTANIVAALRAAVDVCVALIEAERKEWGHVRNCECKRPMQPAATHDLVRDERCAPLPGDSTTREEET